MKTLLKFKVTDKVESTQGGTSVTLEPVIDGSEENKKFFKYTPSGRLDFHTHNDLEGFNVDEEYLITLELAKPQE